MQMIKDFSLERKISLKSVYQETIEKMTNFGKKYKIDLTI